MSGSEGFWVILRRDAGRFLHDLHRVTGFMDALT